MKPRWTDLRLSVIEVLSPIEDWRGGLLKIIGLLTVLGVPLVSLQSEDLRPASGAGSILWSFAILVALALGIRAVYRRRREASPARAQRNEARRAVFTAMNTVIILLQRASLSNSRAVKVLREEMEPAVRSYEEAAKRLHPGEGLVHQKQCDLLLSMCQVRDNPAFAVFSQVLVKAVGRDLCELYLAQVSLVEVLDEDERAVLTKQYHLLTANSSSAVPPDPPGAATGGAKQG